MNPYLKEYEEMIGLLERVGEACIAEDQYDSMKRYVVEPDLDPDLIDEILAFLSKIGRHP